MHGFPTKSNTLHVYLEHQSTYIFQILGGIHKIISKDIREVQLWIFLTVCKETHPLEFMLYTKANDRFCLLKSVFI